MLKKALATEFIHATGRFSCLRIAHCQLRQIVIGWWEAREQVITRDVPC